MIIRDVEELSYIEKEQADWPLIAKRKYPRMLENRLLKHDLSLLCDNQWVKPIRGQEYKDFYELRFDSGGDAFRVFFGLIKRIAWLVLAYKKKASKKNKTPQRVIDTAYERFKIIKQERENHNNQQ